MKRIIMLFRVWIRFTWYFLHSIRRRKPWSLPPQTWILLYCRGFLPNKIGMYQLWKNNWKLYITDRQTLLSAHINGDYGIIIDDKFLSSLVMRSIAQIPHTFAVIQDRKLSISGSGNGNGQNLEALVRKKGKAVLKPTDQNGGEGVILLEFRNGIYLSNNKVADVEHLESLLPESGSFILTEYIQQGAFAASLYPDTVNTIRILTMLDPDSSLPFIACALQRIGTSGSFPVDNVSSGGLACSIDIRTGRIGKASRVFMQEPFRWIERHPDTGLQFEGQVIPGWSKICHETIQLAKLFPLIPYIAWDMALLDDGICIIETNSWSDLSVFQLEQPLTTDPAIRRFFEYHRVTGKNSTSFYTEAK